MWLKTVTEWLTVLTTSEIKLLKYLIKRSKINRRSRGRPNIRKLSLTLDNWIKVGLNHLNWIWCKLVVLAATRKLLKPIYRKLKTSWHLLVSHPFVSKRDTWACRMNYRDNSSISQTNSMIWSITRTKKTNSLKIWRIR